MFKDYEERMLAHRDNQRYKQWHLEATAQLLRDKYPTSSIFIVKPCKMNLGTFSVYSNFVSSNLIGVPDHEQHMDSWKHLSLLMKNAVQSVLGVEQRSSEVNSCSDVTSLAELYAQPKHVIGFSKGCVVLNQLLYELKTALSDDKVRPFVSSVQTMTWLDGGHSGHGNGEPTWVCDESVLQVLSATAIRVYSHVSPYQISDAMRPWKGKEHKKFISLLRKLKIGVTNTVYFEDEPASIENHFQILSEFKNM